MPFMRKTGPEGGAPGAAGRRRAAKAATHARILGSAGRLVRRAGLRAASVPAVMRGAGLTVGGFYAHFKSKRAMDAEVLRRELDLVRASWLGGLDDSRGVEWLARAVKRYLSAAHRDAVDTGCAMPSSLSELTHADRATRAAFADGVEQAIAELAARAPATAAASPRERALATFALCVGGLTLARALRGHPLSDELLRACRAWALPEPSAREPSAREPSAREPSARRTDRERDRRSDRER